MNQIILFLREFVGKMLRNKLNLIKNEKKNEK